MAVLRDAFNSITTQLYERTSSPLMGGFIVSWIVWNYRLVLVLLTDMNMLDKFHYIDNVHFEHGLLDWGYGLLFPLLTSLAFIYGYPWPAKWTYRFSRRKQKELRDIKQDIESQELLTVEQSVELRLELRNAKEDFNRELVVKDLLIKGLESKINSRIDDTDFDETDPELSNTAEQLLQAAIEGGGVIMVSQSTGGYSIQAGKTNIFDGKDARENARWEGGIRDLEDLDMIEQKNKGYYVVINKGYAYEETKN